MTTCFHDINSLFAQLGLPDEDDAIERFIDRHGPLSTDTELAEAPWWTPAQAAFLQEQQELDADWAEIIDQLNVLLR